MPLCPTYHCVLKSFCPVPMIPLCPKQSGSPTQMIPLCPINQIVLYQLFPCVLFLGHNGIVGVGQTDF